MAALALDLCTGARIYVRTAYGEPVVPALKALGAHWDAEKKCWWIGAAKRAKVEELLVGADKAQDEAPATGPVKEDVSACRAYAQVEYKGRRYYVIAETKDLTRCRLTTLDGLAPFWADCADCNLVRRYEGRERWDGRRYSNRTITVYQTIGGLREFRDQQKQAKANGEPVCGECGKAGEEMVEDMEDGCLKHRACCDMPPS